MKTASPLHLWSFQATAACEVLEKTGILQVSWDKTPINWRPAYHWMATEMEKQGITLQGFAPVWAWHSCGGILCGAPKLGTARALFSDLALMDGIWVVEFEATADLCLLSSYARFNALLNVILDDQTLDQEAFIDMFDVPPIAYYDDIQVVLPYLKMEWIKGICFLDIKLDKWDYDWEKAV